MIDELQQYYERELHFIRRLAGEFAARHPGIAGQLLLEPDRCDDPHVERLIEAFALLTARVQLRLDDEFPEIGAAFLGALHPQLLAPVPALSIAQFTADASRSQAGSALVIPRHAPLHTRPAGGVRCRFRTCYPVALWPVQVTAVTAQAVARGLPGCPPEATGAIAIRLQTTGTQTFAQLPLGSLRFFVDGPADVAHQLYELLLRAPLGVLVRPARAEGAVPAREAAGRCLPPAHLQAVGFAPDEGLLERPATAQAGHALLQEYFCFPDKFMFVEVTGLTPEVLAGCGRELELLVLLERAPQDLGSTLGPDNLRLGCTPVANLFSQEAEPIRFTHTVTEYPVIPDRHAPAAFEVIAVQEVEAVGAGSARGRSYRPFHSLRHGEGRDGDPAFWHATRRPSPREGDDGTEVFLSLSDRDGRPLREPPDETLIVRALCSNRDLAAGLLLGEERGDFQIEGQPGVARVRALRRPTPALRQRLQRVGVWKLVSLLQLNHLSLTGPPQEETAAPAAGPGAGAPLHDPVALRELMSLLDFADSATTRRRIAGVTGVRARPALRRIGTDAGRLFVRGVEITLELDEAKYTGSSAFLCGSVLERFFGLYTTVNSFTQTVAVGRQATGVIRQWPPRTGQITLS